MAKTSGLQAQLAVDGVDLSGDIAQVNEIGGGPAPLDQTALPDLANERAVDGIDRPVAGHDRRDPGPRLHRQDRPNRDHHFADQLGELRGPAHPSNPVVRYRKVGITTTPTQPYWNWHAA